MARPSIKRNFACMACSTGLATMHRPGAGACAPVALAVALVVLAVEGDQVREREAVVRGDEVDAVVRPPPAAPPPAAIVAPPVVLALCRVNSPFLDICLYYSDILSHL